MEDWKQLQYLKKGISHEQNGTNCQDNICVYENEDCIVAALADGLGSLKYSEVASKIATESVCSFFGDSFSLEQFRSKEDIKKALFDTIVGNLKNEARKIQVSLSEMDCTLVFVFIRKKQREVLIGCLGDSAVCMIGDFQSCTINGGNSSANGTNAVLDKDAVENLTLKYYHLDKEHILGFILTSDGLENELYMKGSVFVNKNAELYFNAWYTDKNAQAVIEKRVKKLTSFKDTPFDDDISLIILSRANEKISLPEDPTWLCTCGFRNCLQTTYCQQCHNDFITLYQDIRFREHGGKAAFFRKINQYPDKELEILGLKKNAISIIKNDASYQTTSDITEIEEEASQAEIESKERTEKKSNSRKLQHFDKRKMAVFVFLLLSIVLLEGFVTYENVQLFIFLAMVVGLVAGSMITITLMSYKRKKTSDENEEEICSNEEQDTDN